MASGFLQDWQAVEVKPTDRFGIEASHCHLFAGLEPAAKRGNTIFDEVQPGAAHDIVFRAVGAGDNFFGHTESGADFGTGEFAIFQELQIAAGKFRANDLCAAPKQERLVGIISERDYTRKVVLRGKRSREAKVAEIMSTNVFTTHPRQGVDECLRIMTDKHIRHLPVLDGDKVVGVISIGDLVKHVISCQQAAIAHLESYIHGGYLG